MAEMIVSGKPVVASEIDGIPFVVRKKLMAFYADPMM
jgi:hypothetical protein